MSHFFTVVLIDANTALKDIEYVVNKLLTPYSENINVPEYETQCYCVGAIARKESFEAAERVKSIDECRREFKSTYAEDDDAAWEELITSRRNIELQTLATHPLKDMPDFNCGECRGNGIQKVTYNPQSKWNGYVIGGRWNGKTSGIEEILEDKDGFNFGDEHRHLQFNISKVSALPIGFTCYAVVTPDGAWYASGDMGWFGIDLNKDKNWKKKLAELLSAYNDHFAVGCDLHI